MRDAQRAVTALCHVGVCGEVEYVQFPSGLDSARVTQYKASKVFACS